MLYNPDKPVLNQAEIAKLQNVSRSYVSKALSGQINTPKAEMIKTLAALTEYHLAILVMDDSFYEVCDAAISYSKSSLKVRKYAMKLQDCREKLLKYHNEVS